MHSDIKQLNFKIQRQNSYKVLVGDIAVSDIIQKIKGAKEGRKFFIIDECFQKLYTDLPYPCLFLKAGENVKTMEIAAKICSFLGDNYATRQDRLIVIGGGTIGDVAGFAASIYKRGISWYFIPTTLLSQVDSSIGGKVAVNMPQGKNLIGSFWPAKEVWVTTVFLETLPKKQVAAGMAEVIKMAALGNEELWQSLQQQESITPQLIAKAIQTKLKIIEDDWFEESNGTRAALNFGHTIGHALEKSFPELLHGEAVALGMLAELKVAEYLGMQPFSDKELCMCLQTYGLPVAYSEYIRKVDPASLLIYLRQDKKNQDALISFRIPLSFGKVEKILLAPTQMGEILPSLC